VYVVSHDENVAFDIPDSEFNTDRFSLVEPEKGVRITDDLPEAPF
jgi:hypothetical protein